MDCATKLHMLPVLKTMSTSARVVSVRSLCRRRRNVVLVKLVHRRASTSTARNVPKPTICCATTRSHVASSSDVTDAMSSRDIGALAGRAEAATLTRSDPPRAREKPVPASPPPKLSARRARVPGRTPRPTGARVSPPEGRARERRSARGPRTRVGPVNAEAARG